MGRPLSLLLVEDSEDDELLLLSCLRKAGFDPLHERVETGPGMAAALDARPWELVISDHNMPHFSAPDALKLLRNKGHDLPFIIVSGSIGEEAAVQIMKAGAQDYLLKGNLARLPAAVERELKDAEERRARKDAEERIRLLAFFDPLTALPNRTHLCELLAQQLTAARSLGACLAVVGMKLDNLREINNTLGYVTGERVLSEFVRRVTPALQPGQLLARTGGAEFAVIAPGCDSTAAARCAAQLESAVAGSVCLDALEVEISASFGIATFPRDGASPELLLQRTNVAVAQAAGSPQHIAIYDHERDPFQPQRLSLIADLRRAISTQQLCLHYQPKVCFSSGNLVGVEALVRWNHPKLGVLRPDLFISLAEQTGLINPLTRWVLQEAMTQARNWRSQGLHLCVAVNLSAKNLQNAELAEHLVGLGTGNGKLIMEVTESAIMSDESHAQDILRRLQDNGVEIAIDDFGTGYSSFARLRDLPVNEIKIDKSFVNGMSRSSEDQIIVASIIELGHKLGLQVVAEGVESETSWGELANLQCDLAQGYLLSRPMPGGALLPWFQSFVPPSARVSRTEPVDVLARR